MGWASAIFPLLIVTASGGFTGLFVYSPGPGAGNLIASVAAANGTDPYGNAFVTGVASYAAAGVGGASALQAGEIFLYTGPFSGAGPWTAQYVLTAASGSPQVQLNALGSDSVVMNSGGVPAGAAGTTIDGQLYGGVTASIPVGSTETYTNTTLANSANLTATLHLGGIYQFHLTVIYAGAAANGQLKWNVVTDGAGTATMIYEGTTGAQVTNADQFPLSGHGANTNGTGIGNALGLNIDGILSLSGASNVVTMQFAQFAASGTPTTLFGGSYLRLWRIG